MTCKWRLPPFTARLVVKLNVTRSGILIRVPADLPLGLDFPWVNRIIKIIVQTGFSFKLNNDFDLTKGNLSEFRFNSFRHFY